MLEQLISDVYDLRKKEKNIQEGFNRFNKKEKIAVIILMCLLFVFVALYILLCILCSGTLKFFYGLIPLFIILIILTILDYTKRKNNTVQRVEEYKRKINLLDNILRDDFSINSREKVENLISLYKSFLAKQKIEQKNKYKFITILFSALSGILTLSITNLKDIGLNFNEWLVIAMFLFICVSIVSVIIYLSVYIDTTFNSTKYKYECLINDLVFIKLSKY